MEVAVGGDEGASPRAKKRGGLADHQMIGKIGRVTGRIAPGELGEVMVPVRGGTEHFHAYADGGETITTGSRVVVVDYFPPRTVVVTPM